MYTHGKRLNLLTGILCMVLVVMIAISESESMSLNEHSSDDEIEDEVSFFCYIHCVHLQIAEPSTINIYDVLLKHNFVLVECRFCIS